MTPRGKWLAGLLVAAATELQAQEAMVPPGPRLRLLAGASAGPGQTGPESVKDDAQPKTNVTRVGREAPTRRVTPNSDQQARDGAPVEGADVSTRAADADIVVSHQRPRGSVMADINPERTFSSTDIEAFGVSDIDALLKTLGPQVSSDRGRQDQGPVVLINGKRVSGLDEVAKIPTEAIERVEVFPEELSSKYGFRPDQKVVNVVLAARFSSRTGEGGYEEATEGGRSMATASAAYLRIAGDARFSLDARLDRSGSLMESERDYPQASGAADERRFRTLLPKTEGVAVGGTVSGQMLGVASTLNGRLGFNRVESLLGLESDAKLMRRTDTRIGHLGTIFNGAAAKWSWSLVGKYDHIDAATETGSIGSIDKLHEARSVTALASADLLLSGSLWKVPAGQVATTVRGALEALDFRGSSSLDGGSHPGRLSRDRRAVDIGLDVPIANRRLGALPWLGSLWVNATLGIERLSDFGTLRSFTYGLVWSPVSKISLAASINGEEAAPTVEQLGAPILVTPGVWTFDFALREVVEVQRTYGGNADLLADNRRVVRLGLTFKPLSTTDLTVTIEYLRKRVDDPVAPFLVATPEFETAFPQRFLRGPEGRLQKVDSRPVTLAWWHQEQLRWGFSLMRSLKSVDGAEVGNLFEMSKDDLRSMLPPGTQIVMAEPGSAAARGLESMASRVFVTFYHTWRLRDEIAIGENHTVLDVLNGSADWSGEGRPRHELTVQAGAFDRGIGGRVTVNWQNGTRVRGLGAGANGRLGYLGTSSYATVNMALFANLSERFGGAASPKWLQNMRVTVGIENAFNTRPVVKDELGLTPRGYLPSSFDPVGRSIKIGIRKLF